MNKSQDCLKEGERPEGWPEWVDDDASDKKVVGEGLSWRGNAGVSRYQNFYGFSIVWTEL